MIDRIHAYGRGALYLIQIFGVHGGGRISSRISSWKKGMNYACFSITIARRQHVLPTQRSRISRCHHPREEISRDRRKILRFESISVRDFSRSFDTYSSIYIYTKVYIIFELSTRWKVVWLNWTRWIKNIIGLSYLRSCLTCSETKIRIYDYKTAFSTNVIASVSI